MKENGGCLRRISGSLGDIFYAVCSSSTGNVAVGGADRTVTIYDTRRLVVTIGLFGTINGDRDFIYNSLGFSFLTREVSFVTYDLFF
jgi:WD40 repeat protein